MTTPAAGDPTDSRPSRVVEPAAPETAAGPGRLIVLEGGDGAGKSTQAGLLVEWLRQRGRPVTMTFQPGGTALGQRLRRILLDPAVGDLDPAAEALLYVADKAQHLAEVVRPALARGEVVVSDRYVDSLLAYQGAGRDLDPAALARLADQWGVGGLRPDLTILLDVEVGQGLGTIAAPDRLEQAGDDFHQRVRDGFRRLAAADPDHYLVVDGRAPVAAVAQTVRQRVAALLDQD
ncbi:MAG: dTMP kinase [Propionibacteriaceae bacterium]|jgi:dTMP kinase|nr:dTMP kinase [Propionibacteriaceae bacterium]